MGGALVLDPVNIVGFGIGGQAAKTAYRQAIKEAIKKKMSKEINKRIIEEAAKKATKNLIELKVNGPILSIPVSWAIKVVPHINVQIIKEKKDIIFFIE